MHKTLQYLCTLLLLPAGAALAQEGPKLMDHEVYEIWNRITERAISSDGRWALYGYSADQKDGTLRVQSLTGDTGYTFERGEDAEFTRDAAFAILLIKPARDSVKAARKAKVKDNEMPQDTLVVLDLSDGEILRIPHVQSFRVPEDAGGLLAYHLEFQPAEEDTTAEEEDSKGPTDGEGTLVLHNLSSGANLELPHVKAYTFSTEGTYLAATTAPPDTVDTGVLLVNTATLAMDTLLTGKGKYTQLTFDEGETQLAFLSDRDDQEADKPAVKIYRWHEGTLDTLVTRNSSGIPNGWWIGPSTSLRFSESGSRLFFGTQPQPESEPDDDEEEDEDEKVTLDVWNWKDPLLQPMQLVQLSRERDRTYDAVMHLDNGQIVQLAQEDMPLVSVGRDGDADIGIANTNMPYRKEISWESPRFSDVYRVDVTDGSRTLLIEGLHGSASLSPGARYLTWWDNTALAWMAMPADGGDPVNISAAVPHRLDNEIHDWPYKPYSYGAAGWTEDDEAYVVYDKHDLWALDPKGTEPPRSVTDGYGRTHNLRFRVRQLDFDQDYLEETLLLSAFHYDTKVNGFYADMAEGTDAPEELIMEPYAFNSLVKAEDADRLLMTQESFEVFGDLWSTDDRFSKLDRVSDVNPQQADYRWGTAELVSWSSLDGIPLQGMLFKPDGFDPSEQYPMMVYFYEKMSNGLYQHRPPRAGGSSISVSFYVSRGYLVFIPDIPYKVGYPGESALNAVVPGVTMLVNQGFVQADNIGVQGHSWGGYQIAYMVTETDLFKAAEAGAPVSNMISAYGGIRWGSGMSRMFQYEKTQSRIGGSLWEYPLRYIDNSPIFQADKVNTPVLMMHNDDDGAVPWYQGIEFFVALRRLDKPVWMLNYNGAGHGLSRYADRKDWTIRMQQFFDHYLQGAPAPVWMEHGVPAVQKGKTLGLELIDTM